MKNFPIIIVTVFAMLSGGCKALQTPAARYDRALDAYNASIASFNALAESRMIGDDDVIATKAIWKIGDAQIAILREDYLQKRSLNMTALRTLENIAFSEPVQRWLTEWLTRLKRKE